MKIKIAKSHKDKIIGGIIAAFFLYLTLYINHCFEKPDSKPTDNSTTFQAYDSSTQTAFQSQQNNSGATNITQENIGTKIVNHYPEPLKNPSNKDRKQPIIIENNEGSNINTGHVEGGLTQIVNNPAPRNLNKEQTAEILSTIPKGYTVEIRCPYPDQEADGFSNQIMDLLNSAGRKTFKIRKRNIEAATGKDFSIEPCPNVPNTMIIMVYLQK